MLTFNVVEKLGFLLFFLGLVFRLCVTQTTFRNVLIFMVPFVLVNRLYNTSVLPASPATYTLVMCQVITMDGFSKETSHLCFLMSTSQFLTFYSSYYQPCDKS